MRESGGLASAATEVTAQIGHSRIAQDAVEEACDAGRTGRRLSEAAANPYSAACTSAVVAAFGRAAKSGFPLNASGSGPPVAQSSNSTV